MKIKIADIAQGIGKKVKPGFIVWTDGDIAAVSTWLDNMLSANPPADRVVDLYGYLPNQIAVAAVHAISKHARVRIFDPSNKNGLVEIPSLPQSGNGAHPLVSFCVAERNDYTEIESHFRFMTPADLGAVTMPAVNPAKGVVLSGDRANWITAAFALSYRAQPWVAIRTSDSTSPVVAAQSGGTPSRLGTRLITAPEAPPRRGEVWLHRAPGKSATPCVVMSRNMINHKGKCATIVPFRAIQPSEPKEQGTIVLSKGTYGLSTDCSVRGDWIQTVQRKELQGGPIGTLEPELLRRIVDLVYYFIGGHGWVPADDAAE